MLSAINTRYPFRAKHSQTTISSTKNEIRSLSSALIPHQIKVNVSSEKILMDFEYIVNEFVKNEVEKYDGIKAYLGKFTGKILTLEIPYSNDEDIAEKLKSKGLEKLFEKISSSSNFKTTAQNYKIIQSFVTDVLPSLISKD